MRERLRKSEDIKYEPCGHLTKIVVADEAVGRWLVLRVKDLARTILGAQRSCGVTRRDRRDGGWARCRGVLAHHAGHVLDIRVLPGIDLCAEHGVKSGDELFFAAEKMDQALFILRLYQEYCQELPSVKPLSAPARGIEGLAVVSVREAWPQERSFILDGGLCRVFECESEEFL
jgi:hypothetical protein